MPLDGEFGSPSQIKLTKRAIDALETCPGRNYIVFDEELPCFGVRVMPSGKKFFLIQYRFRGRTRRVMLGMFGPVTAEKARSNAKVLLGQVEDGFDPAEQRDSDRHAGTLTELGKR